MRSFFPVLVVPRADLAMRGYVHVIGIDQACDLLIR